VLLRAGFFEEKNVDETMRKDYCIGWFKVMVDVHRVLE
jgi:hypothetical protein